MYGPLYNFNDHTNLGPGSGLQNKRKPYEFNFALGAYRSHRKRPTPGRWMREDPVENGEWVCAIQRDRRNCRCLSRDQSDLRFTQPREPARAERRI